MYTAQKSKRNDLDSIILRSPDGLSSVEVLLFGATVISWINKGREMLFLSDNAIFNGSKAIRGGIPIVFPQFGQPLKQMNQHGFARNSLWITGPQNLTNGIITFMLFDSDTTRSLWSHPFSLFYEVILSETNLITALRVENIGENPFNFQTLLHTYLRVSEVTNISVSGFHGCCVKNQLTGESYTDLNTIGIIDKEVDCIYTNTAENQISDIILSEEAAAGQGGDKSAVLQITKQAFKQGKNATSINLH